MLQLKRNASWFAIIHKTKSNYPGKSSITFLPMINLNQSDESCVYTTLHFVCKKSHKNKCIPWRFSYRNEFCWLHWIPYVRFRAGQYPRDCVCRYISQLCQQSQITLVNPCPLPVVHRGIPRQFVLLTFMIHLHGTDLLNIKNTVIM